MNHSSENEFPTGDRILTARQVAEMLNMSLSYVYKAAEAGIIPCFRIGASLRFSRRAVKAWFESLKKN